jgi:acrylyl-CoA reductase (NADPH)
MKALVLDQIDNRTVAAVKAIDLPALAEGDVRVAIDWSSLNYKDALAITGKGKIIRQFPMVPGIDFAGRVSESRDPRFVPGQAVILTGWGVGENHWWPGHRSLRQRRLAGCPAGGAQRAPGDDHRHRRLYRNAVR